MDDREFALFKKRVLELLRLDLDGYKEQQMRRRSTSFISQRAGGDVAAFLRALGTDEALLAALRDMLTINVTEFFRDGAQWDRLKAEVLPALLAERPRLRIWSAGCSRGQEPYSLAITLAELGALERVTILATDMDPHALAQARAGGPYGDAERRGLTPAQIGAYFEEAEGGLRASTQLRRRVRFAELNLLRDSFEKDFDLVLCRNVMIYFTNEVKSTLLRNFRDSLRPGGALFIGATEALLGEDTRGFSRLGGNFYDSVPDAATRAA